MFERNLIRFTDKRYADKSEVISDVATLAKDKVTTTEDYAAAVLDRESTLCTYVGYDVAIPHAKTDAVKTPFVIYQRLENGVIWGEEEEEARHIFMLGVPQAQGADIHLKILTELSKHLVRDAFRESLFQAKTSDEVYDILAELEKEIKL